MSDTDPFADPNQEGVKAQEVVAPAKVEKEVVKPSGAPDFLTNVDHSIGGK